MHHIYDCSKVQQTDNLSIIYKNAFTAGDVISISKATHLKTTSFDSDCASYDRC
ncbi:hypothetical protein C1A50_3208 [Paenibacillus polymyxa]|nr:hypothetical protein C1A50_3208 [Paenibacillus polymyxa]